MTCKQGFSKIWAFYYTEVLLLKNGQTDEHTCTVGKINRAAIERILDGKCDMRGEPVILEFLHTFSRLFVCLFRQS